MAKINFVLIDFENVQPKDIQLLVGQSFKIKVFLGENQSKVPVELVTALQPFGSDAEYIQINGSGSNALDFHIAYYIGQLADTNSFFHIISKDKGFDPLIKHLHKNKIFCHRSVSISEIPILKNGKPVAPVKLIVEDETPATQVTAIKPSATTSIESVIQKLVKMKAAKPRTLKTLGTTIKSHFSNQISDDDLNHVLNILVQSNLIKVSEGKVSYTLQS